MTIAGAAVAFLAWGMHTTLVASAQRSRAAEGAVARALVAVRDGDAKALKSLIQSQSVDLRIQDFDRTTPGICRRLRQDYGLGSLTDVEIRRMVHAVPEVRRGIVISILQHSCGRGFPSEWLTWDSDTPVVVCYTVGGVSMLSVALRQGGHWKVEAVPLCLSADVLRYPSLDEAILHGAAVAEPARSKHDSGGRGD